MKMRKILDRWTLESRQHQHRHKFELSLDNVTLAQLRALNEMYPGHGIDYIAADLLHEALAEMEATFPYIPGSRVLREDECGDPVYEDIGPTPRFLALVQKHLEALAEESSDHPNP